MPSFAGHPRSRELERLSGRCDTVGPTRRGSRSLRSGRRVDGCVRRRRAVEGAHDHDQGWSLAVAVVGDRRAVTRVHRLYRFLDLRPWPWWLVRPPPVETHRLSCAWVVEAQPAAPNQVCSAWRSPSVLWWPAAAAQATYPSGRTRIPSSGSSLRATVICSRSVQPVAATRSQ